MSKFYAVKVGRKTGVFNTWDECQELTRGFPNAVFKSFTNKSDAENYLGINEQPVKLNDFSDNALIEYFKENKDTAIAYVDGSFNVNTSTYGYGVVFFSSADDGYKQEEMYGKGTNSENLTMRNVAGEIEGSMNAVRRAMELFLDKIIIYYDYKGIECWANGEWKANKPGTIFYKEFINKSREHIDIKFKKVPAHSGNKYNDVADKLAKKGSGIL